MRILEWVAIPFSRGSSQPRDSTQVSHIAGGFFTIWAIREAVLHRCPSKSPSQSPYPVCQWSSAFLAPGIDYMKTILSWTGEGGIVSGWFKHITFTVHVISNLMLALISQEIPIQAQRLGTPCSICSNTSQETPWPLMLCDLPCCIQYKSNLIAHRFAPGGLWLKNIETCYLFAKKFCVSFHRNRCIYLYLMSVCLT